jgi:hypothetical protein
MEEFIKALKKRAAFFLSELEQFEPFGVYMGHDGEITDIKKHMEFNSIQESYTLLLERFERDFKGGDVRTSAIVLNGNVDGKNLIVIEIFDSSFYKKQLVFPYTINGDAITFE